MTREERDGLRALCEAAKPGGDPWQLPALHVNLAVVELGQAARTAIPALLSVIDRVEALAEPRGDVGDDCVNAVALRRAIRRALDGEGGGR